MSFPKMNYAAAKARNRLPSERPLPPSDNPVERRYQEAVRRQDDTEQRIGLSVSGQAFLSRVRSIG